MDESRATLKNEYIQHKYILYDKKTIEHSTFYLPSWIMDRMMDQIKVIFEPFLIRFLKSLIYEGLEKNGCIWNQFSIS